MQILNVRPCRKCKTVSICITFDTLQIFAIIHCVCVLLRSFFEFHRMITDGGRRTYFRSHAWRRNATGWWIVSPWVCEWLYIICVGFLSLANIRNTLKYIQINYMVFGSPLPLYRQPASGIFASCRIFLKHVMDIQKYRMNFSQSTSTELFVICFLIRKWIE